MALVHRILVPTDFSRGASGALAYGAQLARTVAVPLVILHAYGRPVLFTDAGARPGDAGEAGELRGRIEEELGRWRDLARAHHAPLVDVVAVEGDAVGEIVRAATDLRCDLIVMGSHGRTGPPDRVGSVAEGVVRVARCPVLVVGRGEATVLS